MLLLRTPTQDRTIPLAAATLVGRASGCLVRVDHPSIPAHWLEIRWRGDGWIWRALSAGDNTRGTGAFVDGSWRRMEAIEGRGTRISLGDISIELIQAGDPVAFAWDLLADKPVFGAELEQVAEVLEGALLPLGAEGSPAAALRDGQVWLYEDSDPIRVLRAHVPQIFPPTQQAIIDLAKGQVTATVYLQTNTLELTQGNRSIEVRGACVRVLAIYDASRQSGQNGWVLATDAWSFWRTLGGPPNTGVDAVAWERGRLRKLLSQARVAGLDCLVETRRVGRATETRLSDRIVHLDVIV